MIPIITVAAFVQIFLTGFASDKRFLAQSISIPKDFILLRDIREEDIADLGETYLNNPFNDKSGSSEVTKEESANNLLERNTKPKLGRITQRQAYNGDFESPLNSWTRNTKNAEYLPSYKHKVHELEQDNFPRNPVHHEKILKRMPNEKYTPNGNSILKTYRQLDNLKSKLNSTFYNFKTKFLQGFSHGNSAQTEASHINNPTQEHLSRSTLTPTRKLTRSKKKLADIFRNLNSNSPQTTLSPEQQYSQWLAAKSENSAKSINSNNSKEGLSSSLNLFHYFDGFNNSFSEHESTSENSGNLGPLHLTNDSLINGSRTLSLKERTVLNPGNIKGEGIQVFFFDDLDPYTESPRQRKEVTNFDKDKFSNKPESLRTVSLVLMGLAGITAFALAIMCISFMFSRRKRNNRIDEMSEGSSRSLIGLKETVGLIVLAIRFFLGNGKDNQKKKSHQPEIRKKTCDYQRRVFIENHISPVYRNTSNSNQTTRKAEKLSNCPKEIGPSNKKKVTINDADTGRRARLCPSRLKQKRYAQPNLSNDTIYTTQSHGLSFEKKYVMHNRKKKDRIKGFNPSRRRTTQHSNSYLKFQDDETASVSSRTSFEDDSHSMKLTEFLEANKSEPESLLSLPTVNETSSSADQRA